MMIQLKKLAAAMMLAVCAVVLAGAPAKAQAAFSSADTAKVTMNLNLRKTMSTKEDNILTVIPKGKIVDVLQAPENGWYLVTYKTTTGYVSGKYLSKNTDLVTTTARLNLRTAMNTSTRENIILVIPKGKKAQVISRYTNGWYKVKYNKKTGYCDGRYLDDPRLKNSSANKRVTVTAVRMRSSRDMTRLDNIILTIPKGATVTVSGDVVSGWIKATYKNKTGYVYNIYLKKAGSSSNTTTDKRVTKYKLNLRSSMRTDITSNIILTMPKGSTVTILSTEENNWYKISYGTRTGYVRGGYFV